MPTMLYSAELWPLTIPQKKKLDAAHHKFQRRVSDDSWVLHGKTKCAMKTYEIRRNYKEWTSSSRKEDEMAGTCTAHGKRQDTKASHMHDDKKTHAPEEPEGRDRTGLTP